MNEQPHVHKVGFHDYGWFWMVSYGDQEASPHKPTRWPWYSDEGYAKRCIRKVQSEVAKIVREHDRASRVAPLGLTTLPEFREGAWGSDQLT